jgi:hypothetical protein
MKCTNPTCRAEIPDGEQVAVWQFIANNIIVRFICLRCSDDPGYVDVTKEVTGAGA